jgi:hypothetical protein
MVSFSSYRLSLFVALAIVASCFASSPGRFVHRCVMVVSDNPLSVYNMCSCDVVAQVSSVLPTYGVNYTSVYVPKWNGSNSLNNLVRTTNRNSRYSFVTGVKLGNGFEESDV